MSFMQLQQGYCRTIKSNSKYTDISKLLRHRVKIRIIVNYSNIIIEQLKSNKYEGYETYSL
jgi:hypothetical protein